MHMSPMCSQVGRLPSSSRLSDTSHEPFSASRQSGDANKLITAIALLDFNKTRSALGSVKRETTWLAFRQHLRGGEIYVGKLMIIWLHECIRKRKAALLHSKQYEKAEKHWTRSVRGKAEKKVEISRATSLSLASFPKSKVPSICYSNAFFLSSSTSIAAKLAP